ncbi:hypothetical protein O4160_11845 [Rhodococcus sp. IEGM 1401]|uniref:hypothetical protein n=1 Tax=unclassified Rhodococcus (in: high G+C Gram-positive bacteria) TaxID=192944 RepID=UPI000AB54C94|nr:MULTISPECIES: hypothetical protein [unclassified Rhodococcus (in: high G+C Gram-positive bacteria)]MCZ4561525.1 hypothetical protein [Rhodococcus sp. IEGM 1401]MDI6626536.1 hypothetical protein [Rhodococcus sp. (in: high G+C Gram-positive bacteria)]MDI9921595.1 hypothetical protein [Rhodococcus sp. IEGM 1372]MDV8034047.1 hypothetical protein [Rhodococcus sp. IEGM 1414]MDV8056270.1 hypothetical protein [Rhodococcus sp. IEGM 1343]
MCYPVTCNTCNKTGWGGCGNHVDDVMATVSVADRCTCGEASASPVSERPSMRSLFGR